MQHNGKLPNREGPKKYSSDDPGFHYCVIRHWDRNPRQRNFGSSDLSHEVIAMGAYLQDRESPAIEDLITVYSFISLPLPRDLGIPSEHISSALANIVFAMLKVQDSTMRFSCNMTHHGRAEEHSENADSRHGDGPVGKSRILGGGCRRARCRACRRARCRSIGTRRRARFRTTSTGASTAGSGNRRQAGSAYNGRVFIGVIIQTIPQIFYFLIWRPAKHSAVAVIGLTLIATVVESVGEVALDRGRAPAVTWGKIRGPRHVAIGTSGGRHCGGVEGRCHGVDRHCRGFDRHGDVEQYFRMSILESRISESRGNGLNSSISRAIDSSIDKD